MNRNITLDVELYARATQGIETNISKRLSDLIEKGLLYEAQQKKEPTLNECIEMLLRAYKKGTQNTAPIIEQKEEQIQEPTQEEPIIEQDEYKPIKDFLYKRYIELRDEFDDTTPLSQQDVIEVFENNIDNIMRDNTVKDFNKYTSVQDSIYSRFINSL